jgi:hypothetical protein
MRPYLLVSLLTAAAGCANVATDDVPYDDVARSIGPHLVTDRLGDATAIARGGVAPGQRDGVILSYAAHCTTSTGKAVPCGEWTVNAEVTAFWGNADLAGLAHWSLRGLDEELGLVVADTWGMTGDVSIDVSGTVAWDSMQHVARAGSQSGTVLAGDAELAALIVYDGRGHARMTLDDRGYEVDLATGEVTLPTVLE